MLARSQGEWAADATDVVTRRRVGNWPPAFPLPTPAPANSPQVGMVVPSERRFGKWTAASEADDLGRRNPRQCRMVRRSRVEVRCRMRLKLGDNACVLQRLEDVDYQYARLSSRNIE